MIFETHAHYDDERFDEDRDILIEKLFQKNICNIINVGASIESTKTTIALAKKYENMYAAAGVHPSDIAGLNEETLAWLKEQTKDPKVIAVGEIGLDFCKPIDRTLQLQRLTEQAALAEKRRLPIVLHCVKAYEKLLSLMDQYAVPILFHGFTGSPQLACQLIRKGYFLSFGTTLFRSPRTQEALRTTPYEHLFLETDEADTTIEEIYRQAAALRNTPIETLKHSIYTNYKTLFG